MGSNMDISFAASNLKLERAQKHIAELRGVLDVHFQQHPPQWVFTPATEDEIAHLVVSAIAPPKSFGAIVGDTIHNLRAALDLMAVELVAISSPNTDGVYFPFCDDADYLDAMIKKRNFHKAGPDAVEVLKDLKPFKGGNAALRALHDLDIQDKHHSLIPNVTALTTPKLTCDMSTGSPVIKVAEGSVPAVAVTFPKDSPLAGNEIVPTLHQLVKLVEGILEAFASLVAARA
jgi:hypothetical protein